MNTKINLESQQIEKIKQMCLKLNVVSVYDLEVYSIMELYYMLAKKINEIVGELWRFETTLSNDLVEQNKKLEFLLNEGVIDEVEKQIIKLYEDGSLSNIINTNVFEGLNNELKNTNNKVKTKIDNVLLDDYNKLQFISDGLEKSSIQLDLYPEIHVLPTPPKKGGDFSLIKTCQGKWYAIDTGIRGQWQHYKQQLNWLGVTEIEGIFLTHFHDDHAGCCLELMRNYNPKFIYYKDINFSLLPPQETGSWGTSILYNDILELADNLGIEKKIANSNDKVIRISPKETLTVFNIDFYNYSNYNHCSLALSYKYKDSFRMLFQGDVTSVGEKNIMDNELIHNNYDVLKCGHHGISDCSSIQWLNHINPRIAIKNHKSVYMTSSDTTNIMNDTEVRLAYKGIKTYNYSIDNEGIHLLIYNGDAQTNAKECYFPNQYATIEGIGVVQLTSEGKLPKPNSLFWYGFELMKSKENGSYYSDCWVDHNGQKFRANNNGFLLKNRWYKDGQGNYYYLMGNYRRAFNETVFENGKFYDFDSNGICTNPSGRPA